MAPRANLKGGSTEQLRRDIDSGRTGDKVDWPDAAMTPLGTDDEAVGRHSPRPLPDPLFSIDPHHDPMIKNKNSARPRCHN
jgi:hypothetical protein